MPASAGRVCKRPHKRVVEGRRRRERHGRACVRREVRVVPLPVRDTVARRGAQRRGRGAPAPGRSALPLNNSCAVSSHLGCTPCFPSRPFLPLPRYPFLPRPAPRPLIPERGALTREHRSHLCAGVHVPPLPSYLRCHTSKFLRSPRRCRPDSATSRNLERRRSEPCPRSKE
jgi:hypothetical protein